MRRKDLTGPGREPPVLLVKWYDLTRWILEKVDSFPKSQRFIFGTRLADHAIDVLVAVGVVSAAYNYYRGWRRPPPRATHRTGNARPRSETAATLHSRASAVRSGSPTLPRRRTLRARLRRASRSPSARYAT